MTDPADETAGSAPEEGDAHLDALLRHVHEARGFDFSGYKRGTLTRRIARRMIATGASTYEAYTDLLQAEPAEVSRLLETIMINVTSFFRDPELWEALRSSVIPELVDRSSGPTAPVRVWSAGCADGREAYSLAILFAEAVGKERLGERVKIYATDIDEAALAEARRAQYRVAMLDPLPGELAARYFSPVAGSDGLVTVDADLRRSVIFGQHNLVSDAPISRVDLLLCRNTLMYFDSDLQRDVLNRFEFSLTPGGFIGLGRVEMLLGHRGTFEPFDHRARIFRRAAGVQASSPRLPFSGPRAAAAPSATDLAFEESTLAQIILDASGRLTSANAHARRLFGLERSDIERPFSELELSYRPVELRSQVTAATVQREQVTLKDVELTQGERASVHLDVVITPLEDGDVVGVLITFIDVSRHRDLQNHLQQARHDLETAYQELQSTNEELETTNEELQSTNEELETTNEELQSTIEELETTNEELRSTNEEFETMNDELRSVNDKLGARNRSLRDRTDELAAARRYFSSILDSFAAGVVVVDRNLNVATWSRGAEELWGLRASEAEGQMLLALDIGLPVGELTEPIRRCLSQSGEPVIAIVDAHNRRGQPIRCAVHIAPHRDRQPEAAGVVLWMEGMPIDARA